MDGVTAIEDLSEADLVEMLERVTRESVEIQRGLGVTLDPLSFISVQIHVMLKELWPDERDRIIFDVKVQGEIKRRLLEAGTEMRKQQLVEGVGMSTPMNRQQKREIERKSRKGMG